MENSQSKTSFTGSIPAPLLPAIAAVSWGAMFPIAANAFDHVDPFNITAIRYISAAAIFVGILLAVEGRAAFNYEGRLLRTAWLGALGFAGFNLLAYVGLSHTEPQNAAVLITTMPLVAVLIGWYRTGERPHSVTLGLILFALVGVAVLVTNGQFSSFSGGYGDLLVLLAVICWVFYTTSAVETPEWSALRFTTLTAVPGAAAVVLLTAIADIAGWQTVPTGADISAVLPAILFIIIFGAVVAVLSWNTGVRRLGAINATLFITLVPITAFVIRISEGAHPSTAEFVGAGMILAALIATNVHTRKLAAREQPVTPPPVSSGRPTPREAAHV
jgi:drug/metabolite transporter (DMT)-like permease